MASIAPFDAPREPVLKAWTESERKTFQGGIESVQKGWAGALDQLAEYLAKAWVP